MHELGVVLEVVKTVEEFVSVNGVTGRIDKLVLQIGELSSIIPKYVESVYPAAVDNTILEETLLEIEVMPANARCKECTKVFNAVEHRAVCPVCGSKDVELLSGREFYIKEIAVVD